MNIRVLSFWKQIFDRQPSRFLFSHFDRYFGASALVLSLPETYFSVTVLPIFFLHKTSLSRIISFLWVPCCLALFPVLTAISQSAVFDLKPYLGEKRLAVSFSIFDRDGHWTDLYIRALKRISECKDADVYAKRVILLTVHKTSKTVGGHQAVYTIFIRITSESRNIENFVIDCLCY